MGGVDVPQAPRGFGVGRGIPLPSGGKFLRKLFVFFVENAIF